jgi:hypothetical protein
MVKRKLRNTEEKINMTTYTKGNVIVEEIKVGDIHYEYELGVGIKSEVTTLPTLNETGQYIWESKNLNTGRIIRYLVDPKYLQYSANLYDYEAYKVNTYI